MEESQQNTPKSQQNKTNPMPIIGIIVLIIVIIGAFWMTNNQGKGKESSEMSKTQENISVTSAPTETDKNDSSENKILETAIEVEGGAFYFKPNEIKVKKGKKVTIKFINAGGVHDLVIDEFNVKSKAIQAGTSTAVEFTPNKVGTFEFYCSVGNHRQMGMKGNILVE